jgi:two-component sensor histidine kinase
VKSKSCPQKISLDNDGRLYLLLRVDCVALSKTAQRTDIDDRCREVLEEAYESWERKIVSLGSSHAILVKGKTGTGSVRDLASVTLEAFAVDDRYRLIGPQVVISADCIVALNMVIYELATNATKYGAWRNDHGMVTLSWEVDDANQLVLDWVERGGPPVIGTTREGFGTMLIRKLALAQVRGKATIDMEPEGLSCHITVPL